MSKNPTLGYGNCRICDAQIQCQSFHFEISTVNWDIILHNFHHEMESLFTNFHIMPHLVPNRWSDPYLIAFALCEKHEPFLIMSDLNCRNHNDTLWTESRNFHLIIRCCGIILLNPVNPYLVDSSYCFNKLLTSNCYCPTQNVVVG